MKKVFSKIREYVPIFSIVVFAFGILSTVFFMIYTSSVGFADFFNQYLSVPFRVVISYISSIIPFSIAELAIITSPAWIGILIYIAVKRAKKGKKTSIRYIFSLLSVICIIFICLVWTNTSGFYNTKIEDKLGLDRENITDEELYETGIIIIERLNELSPSIGYRDNCSSIMPYSYNEMSAKICDAYEAFTSKHNNILTTFDSRIKPIWLSEPMTYTHLSGLYTCMTGEANVNVNYPDYVVASSAAHEMAHQRGIAREDEANFIAFAVLICSDDEFLQYSAYLDVLSYITSSLRKSSKDLYENMISKLNIETKQDYNSYVEFFKKYANSPASSVTDKINDSFLQANGQQSGTKSYSLVTELVCAYLLNRKK